MAVFPLCFWAVFLCLLTLSTATTSPYLSATTLFQNYEKMLTTFKVYIYTPQDSVAISSAQPLSLFHNSLLNSPFLTQNPDQAHLFYIPFPPDISLRSRARMVRDLRMSHPYWNRTLGADHFFTAPAGIDYSSDRNAVELKKMQFRYPFFRPPPVTLSPTRTLPCRL